MTVHGQEKRSRARCSFAALLGMTLVAVLLGSAATIVTAADAAAAVPGAAPANPTAPCTWNWNRWSRPGAFVFPYTDGSFDPTQDIFSQVPTALGANGWYESSVAPQFSYAGLPEDVGPKEETSGANDSEWSYGVGLYILAPGTQQTITIGDRDRQESHAFAFYNSAGDQFDRYPQMSDVANGAHYVASEEEPKTNATTAGGISKPKPWSQSVTITVPSDGIVYIHYLNFDERIRTEFATFSGACGPIAVDDESLDNTPGTDVTVDVVANDSHIDTGTVAIVGADSTGDLVVADEGTWSVGPEKGAMSFVPAPLFTGDPTPIQYTVGDGQGKVSRSASVSVVYLPVFSEADQSLGNPTGNTVSVAVTDNDSNVDPTTVAIVDADPGTTGLADPGRGTWSVDSATGVISFVPTPGFDGDPLPITYTVSDVVGNVLPPVAVVVSFAPELQNDESLRNLSGEIVTVDVLDNDVSSDIEPTTVSIVGADQAGDLIIAGEGMWSVDERTNEIRFIPEALFAGDPTLVSYTVADVDGNVSPPGELVVDYLPVAADDESLGNPAGGIITIDVLANDPSNDLDPTTVAIDHPEYDRQTRTLLVPGEGSWSVDAVTGAITTAPQSSFLGEPAPIRYTVEDDDGNVSSPAELAIGYLPRPIAEPDESVDNEIGSTVTIDVLANDPSVDIDPTTVKIVGADPSTRELRVPREGVWTVDEDTGAITFDPKVRFDENPTPINYIATDALGVSIIPTSVTVTYRGVVPEAIAFVEPIDTDWFAVALRGLVATLLFVASMALAVVGRYQPTRR